MNIVNDILRTNRDVLLKTAQTLKNNMEILVVGGFYLLVILLSSRLTPLFGFLGGIVSILIQTALISNYLYIMNCIVFHGTFDKNDFRAGFSVYFRMIWVIFLVIITLRYAIDLLVLVPLSAMMGFAIIYIKLLYWVIIFIAFNALPETIYQQDLSELDDFKYSFNFIKTNPIEWFIPNIILFGILYIVYNFASSIIHMITRGLPFDIQFALYWVLMIIVLQIIIGFIMIYRGVLYNILSNSTRKKRYFMRNPHER